MDLPEERILEGLNPEQVEAVKHGQGPLLIVAGAGTGKTRAIAHRIAHLITSKGAEPEQILALTFTEKAAAEMEERVDIMVPYGFANVWISTFHAFGERVLREHALELGLASDFRVLSEPEQAIFFREHLFEFPLQYYRPLGNPTKYISAMIKVISRAKDEDVTPKEYLEFASKLEEEAKALLDEPELQEQALQQKEIARTFQKYQELLAREGKADFGDLVILTLKLFREHPLILKEYQERFEYILVDEFQDTNYAQFQLVQLLAKNPPNITVVGDDDQSIYKFRGAAISNILNFMQIYPGAKQIVMTKNYRSSQTILDTAYRLIANNNPDRLEVRHNIDKRLWATGSEGQPVRHLHYDTLTSESDGVAKMIEEKVASGQYTYKDFAILVRANNDADPFLRALNMRSIPYAFSGSRGLYSREEVRLLISFLRTVADFSDSVSLYHLAGSQVYRMDMTDLTRCMNVATRQNWTLRYVFEHVAQFPELDELSAESKATIGKILSDIKKYVDRSRDHQAGVILYEFLTESGYLAQLTHAGTEAAERKMQNIAKFFDVVCNFSNLAVEDRVAQFVGHLDLLIEAGDDPAT
ncbi:MAG: ATP-dependent helicase, partial [bacterium]